MNLRGLDRVGAEIVEDGLDQPRLDRDPAPNRRFDDDLVRFGAVEAVEAEIVLERVADARAEVRQVAEVLRAHGEHPSDAESFVVQALGQLADEFVAGGLFLLGEELLELIEEDVKVAPLAEQRIRLPEKVPQGRGGEQGRRAEVRQEGALDRQRGLDIVRA